MPDAPLPAQGGGQMSASVSASEVSSDHGSGGSVGSVTESGHAADGRAPEDIGTLRQLWRFRDYGRTELRWLLVGVVMRGCELAADLAAPWPLALVINDLLGVSRRAARSTGGRLVRWVGGGRCSGWPRSPFC